MIFDKDADTPHWDEFLNTIFGGDQELIRFVKQSVGFSLSGLCDLQALIFCYGSGANGKITFFGVLRKLLGNYYQGIQVETLLSKSFQSSSEHYELARVKGARVVVSDEVWEGRKLNESLVKNLTGGDQIHARNPYEKPFSFESHSHPFDVWKPQTSNLGYGPRYLEKDLPCSIHRHYFRGTKKTTGGVDGGVQGRNFRDTDLVIGGMV